jgi:hypothetical protein
VTETISNVYDEADHYGYDKSLDHPDEYEKQLPVFSTVTPECNFFMSYDKAPWPKNCRVIKHGLTCNKYEISRDGKHVHSCQLG